MNTPKTTCCALALALISMGSLIGQGRIGQWTDHYNYKRTRSLAIIQPRVYVAGGNAVFVLNQADNSLSKITQINGLSDIDIALLAANPERDELLIAYVNGNLDILKNGTITNFSELKNSSTAGDKRIRHIAFNGNRALISTGLGILNLNLDRVEVSDTYTITDGDPQLVNATALFQDRIYAATNDGLFSALASADLTIGNNWQQQLDIPSPFQRVSHLAVSGDKLFINQPGSVSPGIHFTPGDGNWTYTFGSGDVSFMANSPAGLVISLGYYNELRNLDGVSTNVSFSSYNDTQANAASLTTDAEGNIWLADGRLGLVRRAFGSDQFEFIAPAGPYSNRCFDLDFDRGRLWLASGTPDRPGTWNNQYILDGFSSFSNGQWTLYSPENTPSLNDEIFYDACKVFAHPKKDNSVFVGSIFSGFAEVINGELIQYVNTEGTSLQGRVEFSRPDDIPWLGTPGIAMDRDENLWVTNAFVPEPLSVRKPDNSWKSFTLTSGTGSNTEGLETNRELLDVIIDRQGQKWAIIKKGGIVVFDEGASIDDISDDKVRLMKAQSGEGGLPTDEVLAIVEDLDGEIWVATRAGLVVFYSPFDALSENFSDARQILVEQDGIFQFLFEDQTVSAIAVDGANRKWVGTFGSGVFLLSEDGTEEILNFSRQNSPLPSNNINDITIDPKTGEVYFATTEGLMSYQADAIDPLATNTCNSVYPNPVRENYTGPISISGLTRDAEVRITDARGNLVFATLSNGGKAIWDGRNVNGERVATGVYFALSVDPVGGSECATKILVIK